MQLRIQSSLLRKGCGPPPHRWHKTGTGLARRPMDLTENEGRHLRTVHRLSLNFEVADATVRRKLSLFS